jgi:hypothetical protein
MYAYRKLFLALPSKEGRPAASTTDFGASTRDTRPLWTHSSSDYIQLNVEAKVKFFLEGLMKDMGCFM